MSFKTTFFFKEGKISKTAIFLSLATFIILFLWLFQSLFAGTEFFGWWTIPEFSSSAGVSVLGSLAALYAVNHGWVNKDQGMNPETLRGIREQIDAISEVVSGKK